MHRWLYSVMLLAGACVSGGDQFKAMLYPRASETRDVTSLDGIWNFRIAPNNLGFQNKWFQQDLKQTGNVIPMPVPSSYNDITQNATIRDHVGLVWYDRTFFVSDSWRLADKRVWLRFSSVHYTAQVWVNGELVMNHEIGHLPFQRDVTSLLNFGQKNRVTVACDNSLYSDTIPQGQVSQQTGDEGKVIIQSFTFDFFNYAGIHRPVTLYTTPQVYIQDVTVHTDLEGDTGLVRYEIVVSETNVTNEAADDMAPIQCSVRLLDKSGHMVAESNDTQDINGTLAVPVARLWWPYLMHPDPGYLYTLEVTLSNDIEPQLDVYRLPVGIRTLKWNNSSFYINNRPMYLHGFGRHEDSDIRGKGLDLPLVIRDYNLIKWVGANAYRTSHYPYADEIMDMADEMGIMIIDECPSTDTDGYSDALLQKHKDALTQLIHRDKNRPSVIAWSLANEPRTQTAAADEYFGSVVKHVKSLDKSRPTTMAIARSYWEDKAGKHLDIISFNRYNGWYSNPGHLDMITNKVISEAQAWRKKYNKPVIMSEYGADTYEGLHIEPEFIWTEEYQVSLMSKHFQAFDMLREEGWFIGEFIWNFADFKTAQSITRVGGNKKGIFTRNRQPKASAHHLRRRYHGLAHQLYNSPIPRDLYPYDVSPVHKTVHKEL